MICGLLPAVGGPHPGRGYQGGDGYMQPEGHLAIRVVSQPDAGVQGDDLGTPHQDDVHYDRQSLMLCWGVHMVAVLAHHTHRHILHIKRSAQGWLL